MAELAKGTMVNLTNGKQAIIKREIGRGGQGIVYLVDYEGQEYALKWYIVDYSDKFYKNLEQNVKMGAPSPAFIWPIAISERQYGSFGYIMTLRPSGYEEVGTFMLAKAKFASINALLEAALQICSAFQKLHIKGLSYQDMNDGNFFINPTTGNVLICDNDNVAPDKVNMGIVGKSGYMAPEIVDKEGMPNRYTDYFSLGVILFILFFMNRPFEGAKVMSCPCMTEDAERKLFGKNCVFIMDPTDFSNRPVRNVQTNVFRRWPLFPRHLRETFISAFSKDAIRKPYVRVMDKTWQQVILQVRSQLIKCPFCGKYTFIEPNMFINNCIECSGAINKPLYLKSGNYLIPLTEGQKIYACQTSMEKDLNKVSCEVVKNAISGHLGIKNLSGIRWQVTEITGAFHTVDNGLGCPVLPNMKISFNKDVTATIIK